MVEVDAELMRAWQIKLPTMTLGLGELWELYETFKSRGYAAEKPLHAVTRPANTLLLAPMLKGAHNEPETVAELLELWPDDEELCEDAVNRLTQGLAELGENPEDW